MDKRRTDKPVDVAIAGAGIAGAALGVALSQSSAAASASRCSTLLWQKRLRATIAWSQSPAARGGCSKRSACGSVSAKSSRSAPWRSRIRNCTTPCGRPFSNSRRTRKRAARAHGREPRAGRGVARGDGGGGDRRYRSRHRGLCSGRRFRALQRRRKRVSRATACRRRRRPVEAADACENPDDRARLRSVRYRRNHRACARAQRQSRAAFSSLRIVRDPAAYGQAFVDRLDREHSGSSAHRRAAAAGILGELELRFGLQLGELEVLSPARPTRCRFRLRVRSSRNGSHWSAMPRTSFIRWRGRD